MRTVSTSPAVGIEIEDLDLREPIDDELANELLQLYREHHLLVFRNQELDGPRQVEVTGLFGPTLSHREDKAWSFVSNVVPDGLVPEGGLAYHYDFAFTDEPVWGISLFALEVTDEAPTWFVSSTRAAAALAPELRARVEGQRVLNIYDYGLPQDRRLRDYETTPGRPSAEHPVVGLHPRFGQEMIFVCEQQSDRIVGLPEDESEELIGKLFSELYEPAHRYTHYWRLGDFVIWDNMAVQHGRPDFPVETPRTMRRVSIALRYATRQGYEARQYMKMG